jgi:hypothetical protein
MTAPSPRLTFVSSISDLQDSRDLSKSVAAADRPDVTVSAWLWSRHNKPPRVPGYVSATVLQSGGGEHNWRLMTMYVRWMVRIFWRALRKQPGTIFFCHRFESAFPLAVASIFRRKAYVFYNTDNVSTSYRWPGAIKSLLAAAERLAARRAILHVVPGRSRWPYPDVNLRIIPNTPTQSTVDAARELRLLRDYKPGSRLTLYVNGWLVETRGLSTLIKAIECCPAGAVQIVVAGRIGCEDAKRLIALPCAEYLGELSGEEALATYYRTHLAFTFYDPRIEINRTAESGKWGDCVATATPFIANTEVQTARPYLENKQCLAVAYDDHEGLARLLTDLSSHPEQWHALKQSIERAPFESCDHAWNRVVTAMIAHAPAG